MIVFLVLLANLVIFVTYSLWESTRRPKNYPPGPDFAAWVGNSIELRKEAAVGGQHKAFVKWGKQYNTDVLGLKLGGEFLVIPLSYSTVKDVHILKVFEGRPDNFFMRLRTMGTRQGVVATDGKLWYEHRNFTLKRMREVGYGRTPMEINIEKEAESLLNYIEEYKGNAVYPGSFLTQSVFNVLWSMTGGKRFERNDAQMSRLLDLMKRRSNLFDMSGGVLAQYPWLRFVVPNWSGYNLIKTLNVELFEFIMETIKEHRDTLSEENKDSDMIYSYMWEMQKEINDDNENTTFNETQLVMTILDFFIAGSHLTSSTLSMVFINLTMRPEMQKLVYSEIQANAKGTEFPTLSTKVYYPYLDAFIMEVQRLYCIAPLGGPRRTLEDTKLGGYDIPKNTTILTGLGSVLLDPKHWGDPEEFRPERFIDAEGKTFKDEYFIPFAAGRRRCLGDALARACMFSFLVCICQRFELLPSEKADDKPSYDMLPGITLSPKPYKIKFVKRS